MVINMKKIFLVIIMALLFPAVSFAEVWEVEATIITTFVNNDPDNEAIEEIIIPPEQWHRDLVEEYKDFHMGKEYYITLPDGTNMMIEIIWVEEGVCY
jgi:hypothetical protein